MVRSPCFILVLMGFLAACNAGRHSSAGFRLPHGGDAERGRTAFIAHRCNTCHDVSGADLPRPSSPRIVAVALGGETSREKPDGYLVTSIINPSYSRVRQASPHAMPDYARELTVAELVDLVEFLQAHYTVRRMPPGPVYY
jgi:cytochrome c553